MLDVPSPAFDAYDISIFASFAPDIYTGVPALIVEPVEFFT